MPRLDGPALVDTNILIYFFTDDEPERAAIATELVDSLMASNTLVTSTQVLQELFVALTRKVTRRLPSAGALAILDRLSQWPVATSDFSLVRDAVELSMAHSFSLWDALIVVAAARAGCTHLYSEDMQHGRTIRGVRIVNPFLREPNPTHPI